MHPEINVYHHFKTRINCRHQGLSHNDPVFSFPPSPFFVSLSSLMKNSEKLKNLLFTIAFMTQMTCTIFSGPNEGIPRLWLGCTIWSTVCVSCASPPLLKLQPMLQNLASSEAVLSTLTWESAPLTIMRLLRKHTKDWALSVLLYSFYSTI